MLIDLFLFLVSGVVLRDIAKKFLEQFAPDGLFYQPKHRRQHKVVSFLIGGDDQ